MSAAERPVYGVAALRYGHQMDVIAHQAPGPDQESLLIGSFAEEIEVDGTVGIAVEDGHPAIASLHHMVRHAGDYYTRDSGHSS
jgi:hypothetical protein